MHQRPPDNVTPDPGQSAQARDPSAPSSRRFSTLRESAAQLLTPQTDAPAIAGDILYGADAIAVFMFGDRKHRRRVYNLVDRDGLPVFRIGVNICARKSILLQWIAGQENGSIGTAVKE